MPAGAERFGRCHGGHDTRRAPGTARPGPVPARPGGSGSRGSLHTGRLGCGATSAASRALLLAKVRRTGPCSAERRERLERDCARPGTPVLDSTAQGTEK